MTALTENALRTAENFKSPDLQEPVVADATQVWQGGMICLDAANGRAVPAADAASLSDVIGVAQREALGDVAATPPPRTLTHGNIDYPFESSGLTNDDVGKDVAVVDDNTVGTITASTNGVRAGMLTRLEGTTAWVKVGRFSGTDT